MMRIPICALLFALVALAAGNLRADDGRRASTIEVNICIDGGSYGPIIAAVNGQGETWNGGSDKGRATVIERSRGHFAVRIHLVCRPTSQADTLIIDRTVPVASAEPRDQDDKIWVRITHDVKIAAYFDGGATTY